MMYLRKDLYPPNWKELSHACKERAGWRCERCHIRHGAKRRSKRTNERYTVFLHAAHMRLQDTLNPHPELRALCPTCHGRYDFRLRLRAGVLDLERFKHRLARKHKEVTRCSVH